MSWYKKLSSGASDTMEERAESFCLHSSANTLIFTSIIVTYIVPNPNIKTFFSI